MINGHPERYDVDFDANTELWYVYYSNRAIASFCSQEEAQEYLDRLLG